MKPHPYNTNARCSKCGHREDALAPMDDFEATIDRLSKLSSDSRCDALVTAIYRAFAACLAEANDRTFTNQMVAKFREMTADGTAISRAFAAALMAEFTQDSIQRGLRHLIAVDRATRK